MSIGAAKFTLEQYEHMVDCGAFGPPHEKRVELLRGEIVEMSPIGKPHANMLALLNDWSCRVVDRDRMIVRPQCPLQLSDEQSELEPDIAWVVRRDYRHQHPRPEEVLLVMEVADSSLGYDRGEKLLAYATAGLPEYWIVNLIDEQIEVFRDPHESTYRTESVHTLGGGSLSPLVIPSTRLNVAELFSGG